MLAEEELLHRHVAAQFHIGSLVGVAEAARSQIAFYPVAAVDDSAHRQHLRKVGHGGCGIKKR